MSNYSQLSFVCKTPSPQSTHLSKGYRVIISSENTYNSVMDIVFSLKYLDLNRFWCKFEFFRSEWIFEILKLHLLKCVKLWCILLVLIIFLLCFFALFFIRVGFGIVIDVLFSFLWHVWSVLLSFFRVDAKLSPLIWTECVNFPIFWE